MARSLPQSRTPVASEPKRWLLLSLLACWLGVCLFASQLSFTQNQVSPTDKPKKLSGQASSDKPGGSLFSITADASLNDYSSNKAGNTLYVTIPNADASKLQSGLRGKGYENVQVSRSGRDVTLTFQLQPGTQAHVNQRGNRLDVAFTTPGSAPDPSIYQQPGGEDDNGGRTTLNSGGNNAGNNGGIPIAPGSSEPIPRSGNPVLQARNAPDPRSNTNTRQQSNANNAPPVGANANLNAPAQTQANETYDGSQSAPAGNNSGNLEPTGELSPPATARTTARSGWRWPRFLLALGVVGLLLLAWEFLVRRRARQTPARPVAVEDDGTIIFDSDVIEVEPAGVAPAATTAALPVTQETGGLPDQYAAWAGALAAATAAPIAVATVHQDATAESTTLAMTNQETAPAAEIENEGVSAPPPVADTDLPLLLEVISFPGRAEPVPDGEETTMSADFSNVPQDSPAEAEVQRLLNGERYDVATLESQDPAVRGYIASALLAAGQDDDAERRERASDAFAAYGYFEDAIRQLRSGAMPAVRANAAQMLGVLGAAAATRHLLVALDDSAPEVRRASVESLARLRSPEAAGPLAHMLENETDPQISPALIKEALTACSGDASAAAQFTPPIMEMPEMSIPAAPEFGALSTMPPAAEVPLVVETVTSNLAMPEPVVSTMSTADERVRAEAEKVRARYDEELRQRQSDLARQLEEQLKAEADARRAAEEEAARLRAEAGERIRRIADEEARVKAEAEAAQRAVEEAGRKAEEAEKARLAELEAKRDAEEAEAQRLAEETRRRLAEEAAQHQAAEETRLQAEADARRQAEEKLARLRAEIEAQRQAREEMARRRAEAEAARREAEEAARLKAEEEARLQAEADAQRRLEEARRQAEEEARQRMEAELARIQAEADARRAKEEAARRQAEEEAARLRAEAEERRQAEAEAARRLAEEEARIKAEAEERRRAEEEAAHLRAEEKAARIQAEAEAARLKAEEEAQRLAAEEMRRQAEAEERIRSEADARRQLEEELARLQAEADAFRREAEEEEAQLAQEEAARAKAEAEAMAAYERVESLSAQVNLAETAAPVLETRPVAVDEPAAEPDTLVDAAQEAAQEQARQELQRRLQEEVERRQAAELEMARLQAEAEAEMAELQAEEAEAARQWDAVRAAPLADVAPEPAAEEVPQDEVAKITPEVDKDWPASGSEFVLSPLSAETVTETPAPADLALAPEVAEEKAEAPQYQSPVLTPAFALAVDGEEAQIPAELLTDLQSEQPEVRAGATLALPRLNLEGDDAFNVVCQMFDDPIQSVRDAAARALYNLNRDRAAIFTRALREASTDRRRSIGASMSSSGLADEAISNLVDESREKTYDAFSFLFLMSKAGEVQPLVRAIKDHPSKDVRLAVIRLLALSGQPEVLPAFRRLAVRGSLPTEVRSAVMEAIFQISSQNTAEAPPAN